MEHFYFDFIFVIFYFFIFILVIILKFSLILHSEGGMTLRSLKLHLITESLAESG